MWRTIYTSVNHLVWVWSEKLGAKTKEFSSCLQDDVWGYNEKQYLYDVHAVPMEENDVVFIITDLVLKDICKNNLDLVSSRLTLMNHQNCLPR